MFLLQGVINQLPKCTTCATGLQGDWHNEFLTTFSNKNFRCNPVANTFSNGAPLAHVFVCDGADARGSSRCERHVSHGFATGHTVASAPSQTKTCARGAPLLNVLATGLQRKFLLLNVVKNSFVTIPLQTPCACYTVCNGLITSYNKNIF